jgi:dUTP pyrophosphatase
MEINVLQDALTNLEKAVNPESMEDAMTVFGSLLAMPDEQFALVSPVILTDYEKSLNNITDKLTLAQFLNVSGYTVEDMIESYDEICKTIDEKLTEVSREKRDFLKKIMGLIINALNDVQGVAKKTIEIPIEFVGEGGRMPEYAHTSDSGLDVFAIEDAVIAPGETKLIHTGIKVAIPLGYELQVRPKSGRCLKTKLRIANTPGTIDAGYRDEIGVIIENVDPPIKSIETAEVFNDAGNFDHLEIKSITYGSNYYIEKGDKIAQLVLMEVPKAAFYEVEKVNEIGEDRGGGFGSTGIK